MPDRARVIAALMHELVDYAGLFPPAAQNMADAVQRYARYQFAPHGDALGRFVIPADRLIEWERVAVALPPSARRRGPWRLSALVSQPVGRDIAAVLSFNKRRASGGHVFQAYVDSIEVKVATPDEVRQAAAETPGGVRAVFECPVTDVLDSLLSAIQAAGGIAKIRTGGVVPEAIAAPAAIARFIAACASQGVPFKATAGLHHPVRATRRLSYEPNAPVAMMNGFLNVFAAAAFARTLGLDASQLMPVLEERAPGAFVFSESGLSCGGYAVTTAEIVAARRFALSFGSCSFEEPIQSLIALGLLARSPEP